MFFVAGITTRKKEIINEAYTVCENCFKTDHHFYMSYNCVSLFFIPIPIFKWNVHYYSICDHCHQWVEYFDSDFENGTVIQKGEMQMKRCSHCQQQVNPAYEYCPFCGNKI